MSIAPPDSEIRLRLQRLWKGTLFVGVGGAYIALLAGALILFGWQAALLAVFLVLLGQCFRYIANDIDRLGWAMGRDGPSKVEGSAATRRHQTRLLWILGILVLAPSAALIVQAQFLGGGRVALVVGVTLAFVEALYMAIRRVNRRTAFQEASYGLRDLSLFGRGPDSLRALSRTRTARVERQLEQLKAMADDGRISQRAYEKARDKLRVELVMKEEVT